MKRLIQAIRTVHEDERGHVEVGGPSLAAGIGAIILCIGAASDSDVVTIIGGVILGVGISLAGFLRHRLIDYDVWSRLDKLDK